MHELIDIPKGHIQTPSGHLVNLINPDPDSIHLDDIATALGNLCRYNGLINRHYSVAQHSMLVYHLAPDNLKDIALLHDAPEAYLGDVTSPLKALLGEEYAYLEYKFWKVIALKFDVNPSCLDLIKQFDLLALRLEYEYFYHDRPKIWDIHPTIRGPWKAEWARHVYKEHFKREILNKNSIIK